MLLPLDSIEVEENRQRSEPSAQHIFKMACSIQEFGLLHAIGVERNSDSKWRLIYGECRLLAISDLAAFGHQIHYGETPIPLGHIAVVDLGALDQIRRKELEFAENDDRENISMQERVIALAELHYLRQGQNPTQTMLETAREAMPIRAEASPTAAIREVSQALIIHKHLEDPAVAKAKTVKEALRAIDKKLELQALENKGKALAQTQTYGRHKLMLGEAAVCLDAVEDHSVDVIITDPPYGIDAQDFGSQFTKEARFDDSFEAWQDLMETLRRAAERVCKPEAHLYIFCDVRLFFVLENVFVATSWNLWPKPLIWHKTGANGALPRPEHGPRRQYECIFYAIRGDRKTLRVDSDVITANPDREGLHPHRKPRELYLNLLRRSARPGDTILDPFCGSGVVFEAANVMQLTAIGIEKDPAFFAVSEQALRSS